MSVTIVNHDNSEPGSRGSKGSEAQGSASWWDKPVPEAPAKDDDGKRKRKSKRDEGMPQVHADVIPYIKRLQAVWRDHEWYDRVHDRVYENREIGGIRAGAGGRALAAAGFDASRLMVTTNIVNTFTSRFARRRPMPIFSVDGAQWSLKRRAGEFRKLLWAKMNETQVDRLSTRVLKDACIRGTGILYIDEGEDDIIVRRVHRWDLYVDPHEAAAGDDAVRQMHYSQRVSREVLIALYPEHKRAIEDAPAAAPRLHESAHDFASPLVGWTSPDGVIDVWSSWHLPSHCDAGDGRFSMCIEGATFCFEEWKRPRFPFAILRRHRRQASFWGQGDVELLLADQTEINKIARDIQRNVEANGHLVVFTNEQNDATPTEKFTGRGPLRVRVKGQIGGVQFVAPSPVTPAHLNYLEKRIAWMHDFTGVSQWSAQGRSPLGDGASGAALDTMEDIQSDRHAEFETEYSHWRCDVGQLVLDACRAVAEREDEEGKRRRYAARWMEHGSMQSIDWKDVALKEEQYSLQIEPISYLPSTRAGKLAAIKELAAEGVIDETSKLALFDEPDLAQHNRTKLAKYNNALRVMEILGDPDEQAPVPEPQWGLELHRDMALDFYNLAHNDGAPDIVKQRYRDYADDCQNQIDDAAKAAAPPSDPNAAAMPGMPPGAPPMDPSMGGGPMPGMPPMAA